MRKLKISKEELGPPEGPTEQASPQSIGSRDNANTNDESPPTMGGFRKAGVVTGRALKELGTTGLEHWHGRVNEEWLRQLQEERGVKILKEMGDNDPVIGGMLFAVDMLIRQVEWRVTPSSEEQEDLDRAEFIESCLYDMSRSWNDTVSEILSFLQYGWSYHEIVYKRRIGPHQKDPTKRSRHTDGKLGWRKISGRAQETKERWLFDDDGGIRGLVQRDPQSGQDVEIPIEKALLFRTSIRKNNPEGRSILRNAFRPWLFKKRIEEIEGIGIERDLAGLPVAYVPGEIMLDSAPNDKKQVFTTIKDIVRNIRRDEQEGVVFPGDRDENGERLYELQLLSSGGRRQFDTGAVVTRYDQRIAMTILADFILLGHDKVGSYSLSSDKTKLFASAVGAFLDAVSEPFNTHAIPRLLRLNGMDTEYPPQLTHGDIESPDIEALGNYISKLAGAGAELFPDDELENTMRRFAGLPQKPEEDRKEEPEQEEPGEEPEPPELPEEEEEDEG